MVEAMKEDKKGNYLTASESQVASVVLLVAGTDTTSNTMTFVAFLLSKHPHVQERLFQELEEAMPDKNATIKLVISFSRLMRKPSLIFVIVTRMLRRKRYLTCGLSLWR
jgi:cytochrome P450